VIGPRAAGARPQAWIGPRVAQASIQVKNERSDFSAC